jgi:hypothetical protein
MTTMMRISKIIWLNPPIRANPKVDKSQRIRRMIAIVLKIPGNILIRKRIIMR